jgi:membrane protein YqaA with SNARE-associated domain
MNGWIRRLNAWSVNSVETRNGKLILFLFAFADASILPLPATTLFIFFALINRAKAYEFVFYIISGAVAGSIAGFLIGHFLWIGPGGQNSEIAQFLFSHMPGFSEENYLQVQSLYEKWDFWILSISAFTPVPFNLLSVLSGVFEINLPVFIIAVLISQGSKFILLAFLTIKMGGKVRKITEFRLNTVKIIARSIAGKQKIQR